MASPSLEWDAVSRRLAFRLMFTLGYLFGATFALCLTTKGLIVGSFLVICYFSVLTYFDIKADRDASSKSSGQDAL